MYLQQSGHGADRVPHDWGQIRESFALLGQLQEPEQCLFTKKSMKTKQNNNMYKAYQSGVAAAATTTTTAPKDIITTEPAPNVRGLAAFGGDEIEGKLMQALCLLGSGGRAERCSCSTGSSGSSTRDDTRRIPVKGKTEDMKMWERKKARCFCSKRVLKEIAHV